MRLGPLTALFLRQWTQVESRLAEAQATNRELHRRVQQVEAAASAFEGALALVVPKPQAGYEETYAAIALKKALDGKTAAIALMTRLCEAAETLRHACVPHGDAQQRVNNAEVRALCDALDAVARSRSHQPATAQCDDCGWPRGVQGSDDPARSCRAHLDDNGPETLACLRRTVERLRTLHTTTVVEASARGAFERSRATAGAVPRTTSTSRPPDPRGDPER